jgi:uncharacterized protein (TIGR02147 family)
MPNIFEYIDFRKFLSDYYEEKKAKDPGFSYQVFADRAGFKNRGFVFNIIRGGKKLSKSNILKLSVALGLGRQEADYFETLIGMNQSAEYEVRKRFYERLEAIKNQGRKTSPVQTIRKDQYEFYSKWYHGAIRSLINNFEFRDDYGWLAKNVHPRISPLQARKSVELLKRLGLIKKQPEGLYGVTDKLITTGHDVAGLAITNFHLETLGLASDAIKELPRDKRNVTGLTLGISRKTYELICEKTREFQSEILELAKDDHDADRVYQYDFILFPVSDTEIKGRRKCAI